MDGRTWETRNVKLLQPINVLSGCCGDLREERKQHNIFALISCPHRDVQPCPGGDKILAIIDIIHFVVLVLV